MGRVPLLLLLVSFFALTGCEPEPPPPPPTAAERAEKSVRDAGDAARDAVKKAGEALRKLGEAATAAGEAAGEAVTPQKPTDEAAPVEEAVIAPVPDETERLEQPRDASVATQEAAERFLEATRKAAERVKHVGAGMAEAFRKEEPAPVQEQE